MALAEVLSIAHSVRDEVKVVDGKVEGVEDKVEGVGDKVEEIGDRVEDIDDKVQRVDGKVQVAIDGARAYLPSHRHILTFIPSDGKQAGAAAKEVKLVIQQTANTIDKIRCSSCLNLVSPYSRSYLLTGNQLKQLLRAWLSPPDPSTNHNISRKAQHKGTAVWFFKGSIFIEWKSTGSLLWIHGKRSFLSALSGLVPSDGLRFP